MRDVNLYFCAYTDPMDRDTDALDGAMMVTCSHVGPNLKSTTDAPLDDDGSDHHESTGDSDEDMTLRQIQVSTV